jgi:hypothetical protein
MYSKRGSKRVVVAVSLAVILGFFFFITSSLRQKKRIQNNHDIPFGGTIFSGVRDSDTKLQGKQLEKAVRPNIELFVGILSAPLRIDRRDGIRKTWMTSCTSNNKVICRFFTDSARYIKPWALSAAVKREQRLNKDLEFMPVPPGYHFAERILWSMDWATKRYKFNFFLRIDDDYFLCLERLLHELPYRRSVPR